MWNHPLPRPKPHTLAAGGLHLLVGSALLGLVVACPAPVMAQSCESWKVSSGSDTLLYPDTSAAYVSYKFVHEPSRALRVTGSFPYARFMSFTLYDDATGGLVDKLEDVAIEPDTGSVNPFEPGVEHSSPDRAFTAWIAEAGTAPAVAPNAMVVNGEGTELTLMIRLYAPDDGVDALGGVPLPQVEAVDVTTGEGVSCPAQHSTWFIAGGGGAVAPEAQVPVHFYRMLGCEFYPSYDTAYLVARLDPALGRVAVLKLLPPSFPDTSSGTGSLTGEEQVRYRSLCLSAENMTTTPACLADHQAPVASDGFVYVVVARPGSPVAARATSLGMGVLEWPTYVTAPLVLYRNMLIHPDYTSGNDQVPVYDPALPEVDQRAESYIGTSAPVGTHCSERQFLQDTCGQAPPARAEVRR